MMERHCALTFNMELNGLYTRKKIEIEEVFEIKTFQTKMRTLLISDDFKTIYHSTATEIVDKMSEFQERDSGWALSGIISVEINFNEYRPIRGGSYIPTPKEIANRRACVNVKNRDNYCFKWAIISALAPSVNNNDRCGSYKIRNIRDEEIGLENGLVLNFQSLTFPLKLQDIKKFEQINPISINVFGYDNSSKTIVGPFYKTKSLRKNHINLMLLENTDHGEKREHYIWIKDMSR